MDASLLFSVIVVVLVTVLGSALISRLAGDPEPAVPQTEPARGAPAPAPTHR